MKKILLLLVTALALHPVVYAAEVDSLLDKVALPSNHTTLAPKELIEKNITKISALTTARIKYNRVLHDFMRREDISEAERIKTYCQAFGDKQIFPVQRSEASQNLSSLVVKGIMGDIRGDLGIYETLQMRLETIKDLLNSPLPSDDSLIEALDIAYHEVYTKLLTHKANAVDLPFDTNNKDKNTEILYLEEILGLLKIINKGTSLLHDEKYIELHGDENGDESFDIVITHPPIN